MAPGNSVETLQGRKMADLAVVNGRVVDVHTATVAPGGVAVEGGRIAATGQIDDLIGPETEIFDAESAFITPGLIDAHNHSYHSLLGPIEHARAALTRGTTAIPESYYAVGIVGGFEAIEACVELVRKTPINLLYNIPVFAYAQNRDKDIEGTWDERDGRRLWEMIDWPDCVAVEEPSFAALVEGEELIEELCADALAAGKVIMGDGTHLTGRDLQSYAARGVTIEHEVASRAEAIERIHLGMTIALRRMSLGEQQSEVQRVITEDGYDTDHFTLCTDLIDAVEMVRVGYLDESIRLAVKGGIDPLSALQMATINTAKAFRADHFCGSLTPGRRADLLLVGELEQFDVRGVVANGEIVVRDGEFVGNLPEPDYPAALRGTVKLQRPVVADDFRVEAPAGVDEVTVRVIGGEEVFTVERELTVPVEDGVVPSDPGLDLVKIAMLDRRAESSDPGLGFIQGWGLKRGAIASTYCPMTFNVLVMGCNDADMALAANTVAELGGGLAAVVDGELVGSVPLKLGGLMSDAPVAEVVNRLEEIESAVAEMGISKPKPFHLFAWTALGGVVPELKITEKGLFRFSERAHVPILV